MIPSKYTFDVHNGWLCVRFESPFFDRPEVGIRWWPVCSLSRFSNFEQDYPGIVGAEAIPQGADTFAWRRAPFNWDYFALQDGGKTLPVKTETQPVPPPKTRVKTRWYGGHWEKYLKSSGWVPA